MERKRCQVCKPGKAGIGHYTLENCCSSEYIYYIIYNCTKLRDEEVICSKRGDLAVICFHNTQMYVLFKLGAFRNDLILFK